jgi:hypothetical protein
MSLAENSKALWHARGKFECIEVAFWPFFLVGAEPWGAWGYLACRGYIIWIAAYRLGLHGHFLCVFKYLMLSGEWPGMCDAFSLMGRLVGDFEDITVSKEIARTWST